MVATAYGVYIVIDDLRMPRVGDALKTVDVAVRYNGIVKEFTLTEFLTALKFDQDGQKNDSHG